MKKNLKITLIIAVTALIACVCICVASILAWQNNKRSDVIVNTAYSDVGIASAKIDDGNLIVTLTNGETVECGSVAYINGEDGVGISSVTVNSDGELIITYTDGTETNLGSVKGSDGATGIAGAAGAKGDTGVGIDTIEIYGGNLIVTLTDGSQIDCGTAVGEDGNDGVGISSVTVNSDGKLVVAYTDGAESVLAYPTCNHNYGAWETGAAATCTSMGYEYRTCSVCGNVEYQFTAALGHTATSCTSDDDFHYFICSTCGTYVTQSHSPDDSGYCTVCGLKVFSVGLAYTLNSNLTTYSVSGIGTCTDTDIIIPETHEGLAVTALAASAFDENKDITDVTIADSVTSIGKKAFYSCTSLINAVIGNGVTSIEESAFECCSSLENVIVGNGVENIGKYAFYDCWALNNLTLPNSLITINYGAFSNCKSLAIITIPNNVTFISDYAFENCTVVESVTFENTSGWYVTTTSGATSGTDILSSDLANTSTAATYLITTYLGYYWYRTD